MPTARKKPLTLGDLISKISKLKLNQILYIVLLIAVFLLGYLLARVQMLEKGTSNTALPSQAGTEPQAPEGKVDVGVGKLPVVGEKGAKVTIVEFSDFECPFCKRHFDETLSQLKQEYIDTGKVQMYYRHFPLDFHPAARPGALASECANEQGKFWEYHDKVFVEQTKISGQTTEVINQQYKTWAQELGLNTNQFNDCYDSQKFASVVDQDVSDGKTAGVSGTPTFFINGRRLVGAQPFASFKAVIDEELQ
jgi:protein-disulfide isomerase